MNVSDVIHGRVATLDLRCADDEDLPQGLVSKSEVFLHGGERDEWRLEVSGVVLGVEGNEPNDRDTLRRAGIQNLPRLAWLAQAPSAKNGNCIIQLHEFPEALAWEEHMEIGVDDRLVDDLRKRLRRSISAESAAQWLAERMLLPARESAQPPRSLLSGSPATDAGRKTAFRLHGAGYAVDVQRGPDDCLRATRVVQTRRKVEGDERRPIYPRDGADSVFATRRSPASFGVRRRRSSTHSLPRRTATLACGRPTTTRSALRSFAEHGNSGGFATTG